MTSVAVLCGGVGAARLLAGLVRTVPPAGVTAVVNTGDDMELHGLAISPDLDTVVYTVAGAVDPQRGWGLRDETWNAMAALERYGGATWFSLGDRDLATHLYRTQRMREGAPLSTVTGEIARAWGLELTVLPVTDDRVRTMLTIAPEAGEEGGREIGFQDYFVARRHAVPVSRVRFAGADEARPAPGVLEALTGADAVIIAPSNPIVSIGPLLAVPGVREAVAGRRESVVAISPLVGGRALKGPADRLMRELGHEDSVVGVARLYAPLAGTLVIDRADAELADEVRAAGLRCVVTDTIMRGPAEAAALCGVALGL
ncbi:MAG: 2-phospho-L-lactate transferase [Thermoanaerobacterales bacterium]|nr:2-phospho-L-lactate transferase [Thermoanaerobacterales bacterium]